jgi:arabinofuranan 3-O-arabinosyltransferase
MGTGTGVLSRDRVQALVLAAVAYLPLLANDVGRVAADTKAYLYLDPGRLLARAPYMWQPEVAMGTVTHQNIGYLWPVGPFFWVGEAIGLPDWITQRLWLGSVLLGAGLGMRWFLRTLGWRGAGLLASALAYMLSPYLLNYVDRHSVILLPWAGLPWLMGLTVRALRTPGWRHAAIFGLVTLTVGGVNASSLLLVGIGPVAWLAWCALEGSAPLRRVIGTAGRIGVAFAATGIWWMVGLAIQARYGLPTLHLTENYKVVSDAATAPELFRGLGYWYFYGQGRLGAWIEPATSYTRWALPLSFALPLLALLVAAVVRFRHRGHALMLIVLGLLVGIGAHPYDGPSPLGRLFRELTLTDAGLALRSTPRALPLSILGISMLLGAGVGAVGRWRPRWEEPVAALLCVLAIANLSPLWQGEMLGSLVQRPEEVPDYWHEAAVHLDANGPGTRVLELPGSDFAAYRWGNSGDPVLPGLMDRPYVARELIPQGSPASAALLVALDTEVQEGRLDSDGLAPLARLMGVGDVVLRSDLQFERFRTPRPDDLWAELRGAPGFGPAVPFGTPAPNVAGPERPLLDQHTLSRPIDLPHPAPAIVLPVLDAESILRIADPTRSIVVSGDADGLVAAAGEGLLEPGRPVLFSATILDDPELLAASLGPDARLVLTDTNRLQGRRWGTIRETTGYTQRWDEESVGGDLSDQRLDVLPARPGTLTVSRQTGIRVDASGYGNPVTFTAGDRPFHAVDGRPDTAWTVGAFDDVVGENLTLTLDRPAPIDSLTLLQARSRGQNRWITDLRILLDDQVLDVVLGDASRTSPGQVVGLSGTDISVVVLEVRGTDVGRLDHYAGMTGVGFAEVRLDGVVADETILLPTDLTGILGDDTGAEMVVLLTRRRSDPRDPIRSEPERAMDRTIDLPWARSFELRGEARWSAHADDGFLDDPGAATVRATASLAGDLRSRARSAFDDDPATAWQPPIGPQDGQSVTITHPEPRPFRNLTLTYRADGLHSAPSLVTVLVDGTAIGSSTLPGTLRGPGGLVSFDLDVPDDSGLSLTLRIDEVIERRTMNWYSGLPDVLPVAIVDVSDGFDFPERAELIDTGCRSDLLLMDDRPVPVRITGSTADAFARRPLTVTACGPVLTLAPGEHRLVSAAGADTAFDLDRLVLTSAPRNGVGAMDTPATMASLRVLKMDRTEIHLEVLDATAPYWLILGQSLSSGWRLRDGFGLDQGPPRLVDGFANGWLVSPAAAGASTFHLVWEPQRTVWMGLVASMMAALACFLVALRGVGDLGPVCPGQAAFEDPRRRQRVLSDGRAALVGLLVAVFSVVNLPSWHLAGPLIGLVAAAALGGRTPRRTTTVLAVLAMGSATALIAIEQIRFRHPRDFVWPLFFEDYHVLGVLAVLCLAAGAVQALVERRAA